MTLEIEQVSMILDVVETKNMRSSDSPVDAEQKTKSSDAIRFCRSSSRYAVRFLPMHQIGHAKGLIVATSAGRLFIVVGREMGAVRESQAFVLTRFEEAGNWIHVTCLSESRC